MIYQGLLINKIGNNILINPKLRKDYFLCSKKNKKTVT